MRPTDTEKAPQGRAPAPLMMFRSVSREQRLKSLLKPARPTEKLPRR
jgi:hypothetical protein